MGTPPGRQPGLAGPAPTWVVGPRALTSGMIGPFPRPAAILVCALALAPTARADRAAVEQTLAEMSRAVRAGDVKTYLSLVRRDDPLFSKEQENWAADLKEHRPADFELSIGDGSAEPPSFDDGAARFELVMTWSMPDAAGKPGRERSVSFPALFTPDDAGGRWLFAGEDWLVLEGDGPSPAVPGAAADEGKGSPDATGPKAKDPKRRVRVKYFPGYEGVAEKIVAVLPAVREHVHRELGVEVARVQEVKVYPSVRHLQASIYLSYAEGLSGWNEPGESIKMLGRPGASEKSLRALLAHEYGHVATFELGPRANDAPWWVLEGVAEVAAQAFAGEGRDAESSVIAWHEGGKLAPWADLSDFRTVPGPMQRFVYKQGQHMVMHVGAVYGAAKRNAWLRAMSRGLSIDDASKETLGLGFDKLDAAWRESVKALAEARARDRTEPAGADAREAAGEPAPAAKN